jgi:hypothetical protein
MIVTCCYGDGENASQMMEIRMFYFCLRGSYFCPTLAHVWRELFDCALHLLVCSRAGIGRTRPRHKDPRFNHAVHLDLLVCSCIGVCQAHQPHRSLAARGSLHAHVDSVNGLSHRIATGSPPLCRVRTRRGVTSRRANDGFDCDDSTPLDSTVPLSPTVNARLASRPGSPQPVQPARQQTIDRR